MESKQVRYPIIIAIMDDGEGIVVHCDFDIEEDGIMDGPMLSDNISDRDTIPTFPGVYKCDLVVFAESYFTGEGTEYDQRIWLENVVIQQLSDAE